MRKSKLLKGLIKYRLALMALPLAKLVLLMVAKRVVAKSNAKPALGDAQAAAAPLA